MTNSQKRIFAAVAALFIAVFAAFGAKRAHAGTGHRDVLLNIVSYCLDAPSLDGLAAYCAKCPAPLASLLQQCEPDVSAQSDAATLCKKTVRVWAKTSAFVAIGDIKMCGCLSADFIHGLVLPRAKVTGIEDIAHLPQGIWQFAWNTAVQKISDADSIALVVNPPAFRSQDQLHIHIERLDPAARQKLANFNPVPLNNLNGVWTTAEQIAQSMTLSPGAYGAVVVSDPQSGNYELAVIPASAGSPEELLTQYSCPK